MHELQELIKVVSRHKIKQIEIIGSNGSAKDDESKYTLLYNLVHENLVDSDEDACQQIYGNYTTHNSSYNRLKNRLKSRLLNTLFFIDVNQPYFTDIESAFVSCTKNWMAIRLLLMNAARQSAVRLANRTIRVSLKYEFTELNIFLAKELRFHFSLVQSDNKKYKYFNKIVNQQQEILDAELLAEQYYTEIMNEFGESQQSAHSETLQKSINYSDHLFSLNVSSFRFIRISYLLHVIRYQINHEYRDAILACQTAIELIQNKPYESSEAIYSFNLRLLSCYIQIKEYDEGEKVARKYSNQLEDGSHNWFLIMFYYFLLCTHSQRYKQSYHILQSVINHDKFHQLYANLKQLWFVNEAFVHFLIATSNIQLTPLEKDQQKSFRIFRFLNDIPIYSKDKRGINIAILIIHVLFLLQQRKYSGIIDRVDALNQYCHRYLKRDDTFRANCFIKMLLQIPRAEFNRIRTERYAQKYKDKLNSMPLNVASQGVEVEIIPYEHLWILTLDLLQ